MNIKNRTKIIQNLNIVKKNIQYLNTVMNIFFNKLKEARKLLSLSQTEMADSTGISQRDVSQIENGGKEFIPTSYIQFLNKKGVDLSTLYDDNIKEVRLKGTVAEVKEGGASLKDKVIELQDVIIEQHQLIRELEHRLSSSEQSGVSNTNAKSA